MPDIWNYIDLTAPLTEMVNGAGEQITSLLPIGIGLMFAIAVPRILRRVINTFLN